MKVKDTLPEITFSNYPDVVSSHLVHVSSISSLSFSGFLQTLHFLEFSKVVVCSKKQISKPALFIIY